MNRRHFPLLGILILAVLLISYFIRDFVREWLVIPLLEALRVVEFNQGIVWIAFLFTILIYAVLKVIQNTRGISIHQLFTRRSSGDQRFSTGRLDQLAAMVENSKKGAYFQYRLAKYLLEVTLEILAYQRQTTVEAVKRELRHDTLAFPDNLTGYLKAALTSQPMDKAFSRRLLFWRKKTMTALDMDPMTLVAYLERQLDMGWGDDNRAER